MSEAARGLLTLFAAWASEVPGVSVKLQISGHPRPVELEVGGGDLQRLSRGI